LGEVNRYFARVKWIVFFQSVLCAMAAMSLAIVPYFQRMIIDDIGCAGGSLGKIMKCIVSFIFFEILTVILIYFMQVVDINGRTRIRLHLHEDFMKGIFYLPYEKFKKKSIGEYISINSNNIDTIVNEYYEPIVKLVGDIIKVVVFGVVVFLTIPYQIGLCIVFFSVLIVFVPNIFKNKKAALQKISMKGTGIYTDRLRDFLEGKKVVNKKTYNSIVNEHSRAVDKMIRQKKRSGIFGMFALSVESVSVKGIDLFTFILLGTLFLNGKLTSGMVVATFLYSSYFVDPIQDSMMQVHFINTNRTVMEELVHFIESYKEECVEQQEVLEDFQEAICLENVSLQYDNFQMKDFCYLFEKGKRYAIIGHSGSGKSTLVNLLMRYEGDYTGKITIDGKNIRNVNIDKIVGSVNQMEYVFKDNFINNVTVYNSYQEKNLESIIPLFRGCSAIVNALTKTLNCGALSGGEKQFVSFMRALVANGEILIMDEPFSAIDKGNLNKVMKMFPLLKEKTIIMVTHDVNENLKYFDDIIIMDDGRIKASGSYDTIKTMLG